MLQIFAVPQSNVDGTQVEKYHYVSVDMRNVTNEEIETIVAGLVYGNEGRAKKIKVEPLEKFVHARCKEQSALTEKLELLKELAAGKRKYSGALLWWLINDEKPHELVDPHRQTTKVRALLEQTFPGIHFSWLDDAVKELLVPALKKQFPDLVNLATDQVGPEDRRKVAVVMSTDEYEWQDSKKWQAKFKKYLKA